MRCFVDLGSGIRLAGIEALAAGLGALLAVVHGVLAALVGTLLANFDALINDVLGVGRIARNVGGDQATDVGAVAVEANAGHHFLDILLVEAGIGAVLAVGNAAA